jgi:hypothetical protein
LANNTLKTARGHFDQALRSIKSDLAMILDKRSEPMNTENEAAVEGFKQTLDGLKARQSELVQRIQDICPTVQ